jgi:hypothetical protein
MVASDMRARGAERAEAVRILDLLGLEAALRVLV